MLNRFIRGWNAMSTYRKLRRIVMIALLFFGLWALTPYLYNREIDEAFPTGAMAEPMAEPTAAGAMAEPMAEPTAAGAMAEPMAEPTAAGAMAEPMAEPTAAGAMAEPMAEPTAAGAMAEPMAEPTAAGAMAEPMVEPTAMPAAEATGPVALSTGMFIDGPVPGDRAEGKATLYQLTDGKPLLRLEEFFATNGPDLFVLLSPSADPLKDGLGEYLQLGALKGNKGNQNYELPADADLAQYKSVVIWCRAFNITFGYATLQ